MLGSGVTYNHIMCVYPYKLPHVPHAVGWVDQVGVLQLTLEAFIDGLENDAAVQEG